MLADLLYLYCYDLVGNGLFWFELYVCFTVLVIVLTAWKFGLLIVAWLVGCFDCFDCLFDGLFVFVLVFGLL